jgi:hypothetical protein
MERKTGSIPTLTRRRSGQPGKLWAGPERQESDPRHT